MMSFHKRLVKERDELGERLAKLRDFLREGPDSALSTGYLYWRVGRSLNAKANEAIQLLRRQEHFMAEYLDILNQRLDILESDPN
jgi:hypothetical protein